ncbi:xanthine dehydrogenase family protein molybdopterin-binding subunit [bacterium]|nr:xanthine dehydrogenase family protein molybdopterin-binding subunit [bacterium]
MISLPHFPEHLQKLGPHTGKPLDRVDGLAKVTGKALYAAEHHRPGLLYGVVVSSSVARARIRSFDTADALAEAGVVQVFTHQNRPKLASRSKKWRDQDTPKGSPFRPLEDDRVLFSGQPLALVVATSFEAARHAAALVRIEFDEIEQPETRLLERLGQGKAPGRAKGGFTPPPGPHGHPQQALKSAFARVNADYLVSAEHHNPMEPHAATVFYEEDGSLTVYSKTQGPVGEQAFLSAVLGLKKDRVRVLAPFVGGAFGSGLRPQYHLVLAAMAALELKRSVRVVLSRQQMFTFGHRPYTWQHVALGAERDGKLVSLVHEAVAETSKFESYVENVVTWSARLYPCPNYSLNHRVVPLDVYTPLDMRAPGAVTGLFAIESAMDELAHELGMDPLQLRLVNYGEKDGLTGHPYSSKELRACYQQAAGRFGWEQRWSEPRGRREGSKLVGWGMATGVWDAMQVPASARARLHLDGRLEVASATTDIGTGTYTVMTQIAADVMGLSLESVEFKLGDTSLPEAPLQGGSFTVASVGSAIKAACDGLRDQLFKLAQKMPNSPFYARSQAEVEFRDGRLGLPGHPEAALSYAQILRQQGVSVLEEEVKVLPNLLKQRGYSLATHSAVFAEVQVDEELGTIEVTRMVTAVAAGRILNPKTSRNQLLGGMVWGISSALHEKSELDLELGRFINHNLAEYHIPVQADIRHLEVVFVEEQDEIVNPLGIKGLGEIGVIGVAAAIANAVFHATGRRVRHLPIRLDDLL